MSNEVYAGGLDEQMGEAPPEIISLYNGEVSLVYYDGPHTYHIDTVDGRIPVPNVTNCTKMIDKSDVLVPWAVKMTVEHIAQQLNPNGIEIDTEGINPVQLTYCELNALLLAAKQAHSDKKKNAGDIGKIAHKWLECYGLARIQGLDHSSAIDACLPFPENEKALNCVTAGLAWFHEHHVTFVSTERKIYSREYNYAGTMDFDAIVDGELTAGDYKSSKYLYDEYRYQVSAYRAAREEEDPTIHYENTLLIRLGKEDGAFEAKIIKGRDQYEADLAVFRSCLVIAERKAELKAEAKAAKDAEREVAKAIRSAEKEAAKVAKAAEKAAARAAKQAPPKSDVSTTRQAAA